MLFTAERSSKFSTFVNNVEKIMYQKLIKEHEYNYIISTMIYINKRVFEDIHVPCKGQVRTVFQQRIAIPIEVHDVQSFVEGIYPVEMSSIVVYCHSGR